MDNNNHIIHTDVIHNQKMEVTVTNILPHHAPDMTERKQKIETQLFRIFEKYV